MTMAGQKQSGTEGTGRRVKKAGAAPVRRQPGKKSRTAAEAPPPTEVAPGEAQSREQQIALAAYVRAEQRNFEPGRELDDWLAAELEVDSLRPARQESIDDANLIGPIP